MGNAGADVVCAARRWIGTPYRHRASVLGHGADCLGLVRGVWREVIGDEPVRLPAYSPNWVDPKGHDALLDGLRQAFAPVAEGDLSAGDLVVFRFHRKSPAKHVGILVPGPSGFGKFVHAYSRRGVVENTFDASWRRRATAYFRFPERSN